MIKSKLLNLDLKNKRVFVRADLNVPMNKGQIIDDYRLKSILPTIDFILSKGGKVILGTHIGRPKEYEPELSTKNQIPWFEKHNYKVSFEPDLENAYKNSLKHPEHILLLDNLRFYKEEKSPDIEFAKKLAQLADIYVNDAFGVLHRNDTSITLLPKQFAKENRSIGFLIEKELLALNKLIEPQHPFLIILGGGKVKDKITLLDSLMNKVNAVALCPAIVFTFLKLANKEIGKSLVDDSVFEICRSIERKAEQYKVKILFPLDYLVAKDSFTGKLSIKNKLDKNDVGISFGPKTGKLYESEIEKAKTIFFNGLPGDLNRPETLEGAKQLFEAMAKSQAFTIVGGGDSAAAAYKLEFANKISHISTGGGVILAYITNQKLPGLENI